jgi:aspartate/methionine/tyrosine aminotransferase
MCGGIPTIIQTYANDHYVLTATSLRNALKATVKATCLILCNPCNPSGSVANQTALLELGICK